MFLRKSPVFVLWLGSLLLGCLLASVGMPGYGQVNLPGQPGTPGGVEPTPPLEGAEPAGVVGRPVTAAVATEGAEPSGLVTGPAPAPARAEEGAAPAPAAHADWWDNISRTLQKYGLFQGVQASGQNSLTFQHNFLEGSQQAFDDDRWDTGDFYRQSSVEVAGPVWKDFGFQLDMSDAGWGQDYTQWVLGYVGHDTAIYFGSLNVNLPGNEFASFSQSVQGLQIDQLLPGKGLMRAFYAQQNGYTHSDTVPGNNTSGPYFLTYTPIIEGSLTVKVNETVLSLGTDYTVDYQTGELDFTPTGAPPRIISSTDVITASYESAGLGNNSGTLMGLRAEEPFMKGKGVIGYTMLQQNTPMAGQGDTAAYQEDDYQGSGTTGPFDTNYRPLLANGATATINGKTQVIANPLVVLVDGTQAVEGVNYDDYRQIGRIIFRQAVPPTSLVRIEYYYSLGATVGTPQLTITGLDLSYQINNRLGLLSEYAHSSGGSGGAPGSAMSNQLTYTDPNFNAMLELRQMQPTFTYIDTSGFNTIESGLNSQLAWKIGKYLTVSSMYSDMRTNNGLSFGYSGYAGYSPIGSTGTSTAAEDIDSRNTSLSVQWAKPGAPNVSYSWNDMANTGGGDGNSSSVTNQLQVEKDFGKQLKAQAGYQDTRQDFGGSTTAGTTAAGSDSTEALFGFTWDPSDKFNLSANLNNSVSTGNGVTGTSSAPTNSTSNMLQLAARWMPSSKLTVSLGRTGTISNGAVSSGFYGSDTGGYVPSSSAMGVPGAATLGYRPGYGLPGYGLPYGGGLPQGLYSLPGAPWLTVRALDAGTGTGDTTATGEEENVSTTFGVLYNPSDKLSLGFNLAQQTYNITGGEGDMPNSNETTETLFATWKFAPSWSATAGAESDQEVFTSAGQGPVTNRIYNATLNYQPEKSKWDAVLTVNLQSGASPTYIMFGDRQPYLMVPTALTDVSTRVDYKLSENTTAFGTVEVSKFDSGYSAFTKDEAEVGFDQKLGKSGTDLQFDYHFIRNLAGAPSSAIYVGTSMEGQNYMTNTFALTLTTNFSGGTRAASSGGNLPGAAGTPGMPSPSTFGGYQVGMANGTLGTSTPGSPITPGIGGSPITPGIGGSPITPGMGAGYSGLGSGSAVTGWSSSGLTGWRSSNTMASSGPMGGFNQGLFQFQQKQAVQPAGMGTGGIGMGGMGPIGLPGMGAPGVVVPGAGGPGGRPAPPAEGAEPPGMVGTPMSTPVPMEGAQPELPSTVPSRAALSEAPEGMQPGVPSLQPPVPGALPGKPGAPGTALKPGAAPTTPESWFWQEGLSRWDLSAPEDWWF